MVLLPFSTKLLLPFDRLMHDPVETIKNALSRALAHYRPIAGRLDGKGDIACSSEGRVRGSVRRLRAGGSHGHVAVDGPHRRLPGVFCRDVDPLLLVQVMEFSVGAVGELARGVSPLSVIPVWHWDDSLMGLPRRWLRRGGRVRRHDVQAVATVIWRCRTRAAMSPGDPTSSALLSFPCNARAHVVARAGYYGNCVVGQMVPAMSGAVASSSIAHHVSLIRHAKEKVLDLLSGFGSSDGGVAEHYWKTKCPSPPLTAIPPLSPCAPLTTMPVRSGGGASAVQICRAARWESMETRQGQQDLRGGGAWRGQRSASQGWLARRGGRGGGEVAGGDEEEGRPARMRRKVEERQVDWYNRLAVVSWLNLGFDAADFGSGGAAHVTWQCGMRSGRDVVNVSSLCVMMPEHADAFLGELESVERAQGYVGVAQGYDKGEAVGAVIGGCEAEAGEGRGLDGGGDGADDGERDGNDRRQWASGCSR
ncbi:hypothetical protein SETIT_7G012300v2 [Setaria italica]|uniref:Uncharacterized protein n=1 Tax=Setaria italica TaxID=4555 RepID=A0A368RQW4_SETIT|nr:hypothetical protein SETIT_7G012300v2 [Setaria italica]